MTVVRTGMADKEGFKVVQKAGYRGGLRDWSRYSKRLGLRHEKRIRGILMKNGTVTMIKMILAWITTESPIPPSRPSFLRIIILTSISRAIIFNSRWLFKTKYIRYLKI